MAVSLSKTESINKINLRKDAVVDLTKKSPVLSNLKANIAIVLDFSYSMENLYKNGAVQEILERLIPLALTFDDNGVLDFWLFTDNFYRVGDVTMNNFYGFIDNVIMKNYRMGLTKYAPVMNDVYKKYIVEDNIQNSAYVMFITDGDCSDKADTFRKIKELAQYPIFWQFIGIGNSRFDTLEALDDLTDRVIDNADFFQVSAISTMSDNELYSKLMTEYPVYLQEAVTKNILKQNIIKENRVMAVNLSKGGKVSLAKVAADAGISGGLNELIVGLGWDCNKYDGGADFDLDASAFCCGSTGKVTCDEDFVFYNNKVRPGVEHQGDNRTGDGDGDDEVINITLSAVPANIDEINFTVTINDADKNNQNFGMVENSYIRIVDKASGQELIRYDLGEDFSVETALVVAKLYRNNGEWKFNAIGSGFSGGLAALCKNFGVNV